MASIFGHATAAVALSHSFSKQLFSWKFWLSGVACAILPDADVIAFKFGIAYEDMFGHRGISHSILFALTWGLLVVLVFYRKASWSKAEAWALWVGLPSLIWIRRLQAKKECLNLLRKCLVVPHFRH